MPHNSTHQTYYDDRYQNNCLGKYSGKSKDQLFEILKEKSWEIYNGYQGKLSKLSVFSRIINLLFGKEKEVNEVYTSIVNQYLCNEVIELVNQEVIPKKHLFYKEDNKKLDCEKTLQSLHNLSTEELFTILSNEKVYSSNFQEVRKMFGLMFSLKRNKEVTKDVDNTIKQKGNEALILSVKNGDKGISELLLQHGADPNFLASNGSAPLHFAAQAGLAGIVKLLLKNGAEVNKQSASRSKATPLDFACGHGSWKYYMPNAKVVKFLLKGGANPNTSRKNAITPLDIANSSLGIVNKNLEEKGPMGQKILHKIHLKEIILLLKKSMPQPRTSFFPL